MSAKSLLLLCFLFTLFSVNSQNYPGGVTGAEVWYMANLDQISHDEFINSAQTDILINKCGDQYEKDLFNFNPSIFSEKLCLKYSTPLENSTGRNAFFVGEPFKTEYSFSHLGTLWNEDLAGLFPTDSIIRNFFDFNNKSIYTKDIFEEYTSDDNAHVNFYHINHYNIDKKFKSYGQEGETEIHIGSITGFDQSQSYDDEYFYGHFPEFISFPRELSFNERNRVESYLALKYGLTLNKEDSYVNSRNIVFWNKENNGIFSHRIFGFGKDNISGLNQLQSESTHLKGHLISAIGEIMETNMKKQEHVDIPNNYFLVFGDNGEKPDLANENNHNIKFWKKVWLAQRTGKSVYELPIHFKLFLTDELMDYLHSHPEESIWLMHDKFIGNDEISEFDSENLKYYAGDINLDEGFAYFEDVHFDSDNSIYDQFTFGVGPQMIVQAQIIGCKEDKLEVHLNITGGKPKYTIVVESESGNFEDSTEDSTYSFSAENGATYHVTLYDDQGLVAETEITVEAWDFWIDLGGTHYLSSNQPEITLDAGQGIDDPNATYEWQLDGNLLPDNGSTLTTSEPGYYIATVTSADQSCTIYDKVYVKNKKFKASLSITQLCGSEYSNTLFIDIDGGIPPFVTNITGQGGTSVNHVHSGSTSITDFAYGTYYVTITDSAGITFTDSIEFLEAEEIILDIYSQLEAICNSNNSCVNYNYPNAPFFLGVPSDGSSFSIDASLGVSNQNVEYQWYVNGQSTGTSGSVLTLSPGFYCDNGTGESPMFTVMATDIVFGCIETQSFIAKGFCPEQTASSQPVADTSNGALGDEQATMLKTMVYPNPSEKNQTFIYEVFSTESFSGTVELYTIGGSRLYNIQTSNAKNHKLLFNLNSAGVYLIKITTSLGDIKTDRIIIK